MAPGSLRQAILDADNNPGPNTIAFAIGKGGVQTIAPESPLPKITNAVTIDGTPIIELSGAQAGPGAIGLYLAASDCIVRGLVINRFADTGIRLSGSRSHDNLLAGNYIGTDITGTLALGNRVFGVILDNGAFANLVGTVDAPEDGNVLSGNGLDGIAIQAADHNVIAGKLLTSSGEIQLRQKTGDQALR